MQYRAAVKTISHHAAVEALVDVLDRSIKAGAPPHVTRAPLPAPNEWDGLAAAAAAPSDFWFRAVGCRANPAAPPLDR